MASVVQEELKVCRVCLALDIKMYNMKDFRLSEMFQNITGITAIDKKGSMLQRVCWECAARLTAAAAFREKALLSDALLKEEVHIKESDIVLLKENYSSLKSTLSVVTSYDIECKHTMAENKEIDNIFTPNDKAAIKERKTKTRMNEKDIEFEEYEPWIDVPVKTEVESDPIAVNNVRFHDRKSDTVFEHSNDASLREDSEDEMTNTEVQINNNDKILGNIENEVPNINDDNIIFEEDNETVDKKPKLDGIGNIVYDDSSEEDIHSEEVSFNKYKQNMSSKVGIKKKRASIKNNESLIGKIIALNNKGLPVTVIAKETGTSRSSIYAWLHKTDAGKEIASSSKTVRRRMRPADHDHIPMKKPVRTVNKGLNMSKNKALHDHLKQRIVALKQEGMPIRRIAYVLGTTRVTVRKWWDRWRNEGHMNNHKSTGTKRKTTTQEDQLLTERVAQEQTVHIPSLAKEFGVSTKCIRNRLREAGFRLQERKASVPLRSGRSHKVDEVTKQKIISMKQNGVSVTEIANQFRVTRTSVYLWWRRWCKENNIKITRDNNTSTTEQDKSSAEQTTVEKIVQVPSILSSKKSLWQKLPDVEFIS